MQTIILAAGMGTRLEPLTNTMSKAMVPIANMPFIEWSIKYIGRSDIFVVINKKQKDLENYLKEKGIELIYQEKPAGTGDALLSCRDHVKGKFTVLNADCLFFENDFKKISTGDYVIGGFPVSDVKQFGSVIAENGFAMDIKEKSMSGKGTANAGLYSIDDEIFKILEKTKKSERGELEITDAVKILMNDHEMKLVELDEWKTITHPWDMLDINNFILEKEGSNISENAEIKSGAYIEGNVAIGESVIGPNCYIRSGSAIGNDCKVGNAVEIKNSIVMDSSFISHLSYVGDSIVGRNCNVGAGTIFANLRLDEKTVNTKVKGEKTDSTRKKLGGILGDNVKLGVNVTIMPGKKVWNNMLIPSNAIVTKNIEEQPDLKSNLGKII